MFFITIMCKQSCTFMEPCGHVICMDCVLHVFVCPDEACESSMDEESSMFLLTHIETQQVTGGKHNKLVINCNIICYFFKFTGKRFKSRQKLVQNLILENSKPVAMLISFLYFLYLQDNIFISREKVTDYDCSKCKKKFNGSNEVKP